MSPDGWLTLGVIALAVAAMAAEWMEPPLALGGSIGVLLLLGVIEPAQALSGFANPAVATVGLLLVIAGCIERSRWMTWITNGVLGRRGGRLAALRSGFSVAGLSAFLANTAVVAILIPGARAWGDRNGEPASRLLMPISFAAILGGACTLVGTSTNLVVHGMLLDRGDLGFGMFELAPVAVPLAVLGILYMALVGTRMLPRRPDILDSVQESPREYVARVRVSQDSRFAGQKVASLRHLKDVYLAGLERDGELESPVGPEADIHAGDVLVFVGRVGNIAEALAHPGLVVETGDAAESALAAELSHLVEVVVSRSAPMVGSNVRDAGFRGRYDAVVLAVHRHGERLAGKIGSIVLRPGDTLLLRAGPDFLQRWGHSRDFYLVTSAGTAPEVGARDWIEPAVLVGVVLVAALGILPLLEASVAGVLALVGLRRFRARDVWRSVDWPTLITIATAIGLGEAVVASGIAGGLAQVVTEWAGTAHPVLVVGGILATTSLLTEGISNVAAAALMFPIAVAAAAETGLALHPLAVAIALGASASFLSPVGYQTNTMVAGAAGYSVRDFFRVGLPLKTAYVVLGSVLVPFVWGVL